MCVATIDYMQECVSRLVWAYPVDASWIHGYTFIASCFYILPHPHLSISYPAYPWLC